MAKLPQQWTASDGSSTVTTDNAGIKRIEQDTTLRIEQDGTVRILQDVVVVPKYPAVWDNL